MRIFISITHPADFHFYKHYIIEALTRGDEVKICIRPKDVLVSLMDGYDFDYNIIDLGTEKINFINQILYTSKLLNYVKEFNPHILTGVGGTTISHISFVTKIKSIVFAHTEHTKIANAITFPFSTVICSPECYSLDLGRNHIKYKGYHELAYLHPNWFLPDDAIFNYLGLENNAPYILLRLTSFNAFHDIGKSGLKISPEFIKRLEEYGEVFISAQSKLPKSLEKYQLEIPPNIIHDVLFYSKLYIGDGASMASESAVLGTHAIYANPLPLGYLTDLEKKYQLVYNMNGKSSSRILAKALTLLDDSGISRKGKVKRKELIKDNIDVTQYMLDLLK